jgi:acetyl esterase
MQLLFYPTVDSTSSRASVSLFERGFFLTHEDMLWFQSKYIPEGVDVTDARISPLLAPDLSGMPPALIVTAGFDPLRDEGEEYAQALRKAGTHVELIRLPDMIHGFINLGSLSRGSRAALSRIALRAHDLLWFPRVNEPKRPLAARDIVA